MFRDDQQFFYADGSSRHRPAKPGDKRRRQQRRQRHNAWLADRIPWSDELQAVWRWQDEAAWRDAQCPRPARPRRRVRRIKPRILRKQILAAIVASNATSVTKEDMARMFQVAEHAVEQVFHWLNREGVLSQRRPAYAHDTNRNSLFPGSPSGWASDVYAIRDRERATDLLIHHARP